MCLFGKKTFVVVIANPFSSFKISMFEKINFQNNSLPFLLLSCPKGNKLTFFN